MALDLSRFDALAREVLEAEAKKRGIRSPEFRTRAELIRLILRSQYGDRIGIPRELLAQGAKTVSQARGLLGEVVGAAMAVLPEPLDALARLRSRWPLPPGRPPTQPGANWPAPKPPAPRPEPTPSSHAAAPNAVAASAPAVAAPAVPAPAVPESSPEPAAARATPTFPAAAFAEPTTPRASERPSAAPRGAFSTPPPPPPRPSSEPATRTFVEEPIRTRSMARLLAAQGHRERALAIYTELLAQNSEDASLRGEAEALRRGEQTGDARLSAPAPAPAPGTDTPFELPDGGDRLWCEGNPEDGLRLRWQLSEQGQQRARAVLGQHGELAIRVVAIKPDSADVVRSEITEHGPVDARGEWVAPSLYAVTRCFAAVGLRDGERFVAVVHARPHAS